jgi:hypothetical protein
MFSDYQHFTAGVHGNDFDDPFSSNVWGSHMNLPRECIENFGENFLACTTMHTRYKYFQSPVYVIQAQYDPKHIHDIGGAPEPEEMLANNDEMDSLKAYINMVGDATRASLEQITNSETHAVKPHPDGPFESSCLHHNAPLHLGINDLHWIPLLYDWFFQNNEFQDDHQLVETCSNENGQMKLPCNVVPSCTFHGVLSGTTTTPTPTDPSSTTTSTTDPTPTTTTPTNPIFLVCALVILSSIITIWNRERKGKEIPNDIPNSFRA